MLAKAEADVVLGGPIRFPVLLEKGTKGLWISQVRVVNKENLGTSHNFTFYEGEAGERGRKTLETTGYATLTEAGDRLLIADMAWIRC